MKYREMKQTIKENKKLQLVILFLIIDTIILGIAFYWFLFRPKNNHNETENEAQINVEQQYHNPIHKNSYTAQN